MRRVLVIDDEELVQEVVQGCLEELAGWQVMLATGGQAGLTIATQEQPDAILLDVSMPEMDGIETLQKLQENPATQSIPVIFLTAKVQPTDKVRFANLNIAGMIAKPFEPLTLTDEIAKILDWQTY